MLFLVVVSAILLFVSIFLHGTVGLVVFAVGALIGLGGYVYLRRAFRRRGDEQPPDGY